MKNNKWNEADCGPKLTISEGGFLVEYNGRPGLNSIRTILPIPFFNLNLKKPSVAAYFEVQINKFSYGNTITIGFCTQQFLPKGKCLGKEKNSIGICDKYGMRIDGEFKKFGNDYEFGFIDGGDLIGVGIIHYPANSPMKCFATCNGELLGTIELPEKFATLKLFPASTICYSVDSIRANFGQGKWLFNPSQLLK